MTVSIIIAVKGWQNNLKDCISKCLELDFPDFEILILPDFEIGTVSLQANECYLKGTVPIRVVPTGPVSPAKKRDIAINYAKGEILAFIDDDAYPSKDWLKNATKNFADPEVTALCGPAMTPENDRLMQKTSGAVYTSVLVSGKYVYRYTPRKRRTVDDYPSCNFLVRKSIMQELGGFNTSFWPGEDTKLCLDITKKLNKKIIYDPSVLVYHHRRPLFIPHLKQISSYALHRGYFVKRFPSTSLKVPYFIPSIFLFAVLSGAIFALFSTSFRLFYFLGSFFYLLLVLVFSINSDLRLVPFVFLGIILTHFTYGIYFLKGLMSRRLKEE